MGEHEVRLQAITSHSWENSSAWCVPQNIPSLEKPPMTLRMLKISGGYTKKMKNYLVATAKAQHKKEAAPVDFS